MQSSTRHLSQSKAADKALEQVLRQQQKISSSAHLKPGEGLGFVLFLQLHIWLMQNTTAWGAQSQLFARVPEVDAQMIHSISNGSERKRSSVHFQYFHFSALKYEQGYTLPP